MTSEELQAKVSKLEQQTEKNDKAIAKLKKQVAECKYLIKILSDNSKYQKEKVLSIERRGNVNE